MLLMQAVCPGLAFSCGCQHEWNPGSIREAGCCCCGKTEVETTASCPHCNPPVEADTPASGEPGSGCHCGDFAPVAPAEQTVPESSESSLRHILDLIVGIHPGLTTKVVLMPAPAPPPVLSSEELTRNYKQIVLGVWLT